MKCKICNKEVEKCFNHVILNKYDVDYFFCESCQFIQTEEPFWLDEAYTSAIGYIDTGLIKRNIFLSNATTIILYLLYSKNGNFLDYGGGNGMFVRLMRDIGFNFYWQDKFASNIFAKGFEYRDVLDNVKLITCFECFEHFNDPLGEIEKLLKISNSILFSTELFKGSPPKPLDWWYYNFECGQHISLYSKNSLIEIANKFNLNFDTNNKALCS